MLVTDGNVGSHQEGMTRDELVEIRRAEQRAAAEVVGAVQCEFLGYHDGLLEPTLHLKKELVRLIRTYRPDAIVTLDPTSMFLSDSYINHPDHRATALAVLDAVYPLSSQSRIFPDLIKNGFAAHCVDHLFVRNDNEANFYIDVSDMIEIRDQALLQHRSQFIGWNPTEAVRRWNAETGKMVGLAFAEGYRHISLCDRKPFPD